MLTISETATPKFSYKNILKHPLTKELFTKFVSQIGMKEDARKILLSEFSKTINNFEDFAYTGDIADYEINLYTNLSDIKDINKGRNLIDIISTKEFVSKTSEAIQNIISISLTDNKGEVSLKEYIHILKKKGERTTNILAILRGLYSFDDNRQIQRDTNELIAALKKHLIVNNENETTKKIKSLILKKNNMKQLGQNIQDKKRAEEYIPSSIKNIVKYELNLYKKDYRYLGKDIFSIKLEEDSGMEKLLSLLKKYPEHKELTLKLMKDKITKLQKNITHRKDYIDNFNRPTREERCARAPYRGAPIKSDQEYQKEKHNAEIELNLNTKNLKLIKRNIYNILYKSTSK